MKRKWLVVAACAAGLLFCTSHAVNAQDRDRHDRDRDRMGQFDDHDRQVLRMWFHDHSDYFEQRRNEGWRDDELDRRLQPGSVLDTDIRRWSHELPDDVAARMSPIPRYWRIVTIGNHVLLVDDNWQIRDLFHFDRFNDRDRQIIHDWNRDHQDFIPGVLRNFGVRVDTEDFDRRLQVGMIVDPELRKYVHPAPRELSSRLTPGPRDSHYLVIGDRLCLVNHDWRVLQSYHFEH